MSRTHGEHEVDQLNKKMRQHSFARTPIEHSSHRPRDHAEKKTIGGRGTECRKVSMSVGRHIIRPSQNSEEKVDTWMRGTTVTCTVLPMCGGDGWKDSMHDEGVSGNGKKQKHIDARTTNDGTMKYDCQIMHW